MGSFSVFRRMLPNLIFGLGIVLVSSVVLLARSTPDALMGADSPVGAVRTVGFCALPTLLLYTALIRGKWLVPIAGLALAIWLAQMWWGVATDWHSTASLGPFFQGWLLGPAVVVTVAVVARPRPPSRSTIS